MTFQKLSSNQLSSNSLGLDRLFFRDGFGSVNPEHILNDIRFAVNNHGVQWVILDHLSILMSGLENEDERKCIDRTMTMLRSFCEELRWARSWCHTSGVVSR